MDQHILLQDDFLARRIKFAGITLDSSDAIGVSLWFGLVVFDRYDGQLADLI